MYLAGMRVTERRTINDRFEIPDYDVDSKRTVQVRGVGAEPGLGARAQVDVPYERESK
jgi:hypothetical protein